MSGWHSLEMWYYTAVLILVGCLKNPEIQVDAISIWSVPFASVQSSSNSICLCISQRTRWQACVPPCIVIIQ